jgi:rhodanese-related sulfurtransferase
MVAVRRGDVLDRGTAVHEGGAGAAPEARIGEVPEGEPVVVYCRSGGRSARAATALRAHGFEVHDLGAMSNWDAHE